MVKNFNQKSSVMAQDLNGMIMGPGCMMHRSAGFMFKIDILKNI